MGVKCVTNNTIFVFKANIYKTSIYYNYFISRTVLYCLLIRQTCHLSQRLEKINCRISWITKKTSCWNHCSKVGLLEWIKVAQSKCRGWCTLLKHWIQIALITYTSKRKQKLPFSLNSVFITYQKISTYESSRCLKQRKNNWGWCWFFKVFWFVYKIHPTAGYLIKPNIFTLKYVEQNKNTLLRKLHKKLN